MEGKTFASIVSYIRRQRIGKSRPEGREQTFAERDRCVDAIAYTKTLRVYRDSSSVQTLCRSADTRMA